MIKEEYRDNALERPGSLRANIVTKYVNTIMGKEALYTKNFNICKKMIQLKIDNRVLNQMRQTMNESIEDEKGLMSKKDFKKMLFTSFGRIPVVNKQIVYDMLLTIISADESCMHDGLEFTVDEYIQIEKLGKFIDFYNYVPIMIN